MQANSSIRLETTLPLEISGLQRFFFRLVLWVEKLSGISLHFENCRITYSIMVGKLFPPGNLGPRVAIFSITLIGLLRHLPLADGGFLDSFF